MLRISVTTLEQFRLVCETDWAREDELIAKVKGEPTGDSWQARTGRGIHKFLEIDQDSDPICMAASSHAVGDYVIDNPTVWELRSASIMPPAAQAVREVKITGKLLGTHPALLVGIIDLLHADTCFDYKCKFSSWSVADYEPSLQWRSYLALTGCRRFSYNVLSFFEPRNKGELLRFKGGEIVNFWTYADIEEDILEWVNRFCDWLDIRKLTHFLEKPNEDTDY